MSLIKKEKKMLSLKIEKNLLEAVKKKAKREELKLTQILEHYLSAYVDGLKFKNERK